MFRVLSKRDNVLILTVWYYVAATIHLQTKDISNKSIRLQLPRVETMTLTDAKSLISKVLRCTYCNVDTYNSNETKFGNVFISFRSFIAFLHIALNIFNRTSTETRCGHPLNHLVIRLQFSSTVESQQSITLYPVGNSRRIKLNMN